MDYFHFAAVLALDQAGNRSFVVCPALAATLPRVSSFGKWHGSVLLSYTEYLWSVLSNGITLHRVRDFERQRSAADPLQRVPAGIDALLVAIAVVLVQVSSALTAESLAILAADWFQR